MAGDVVYQGPSQIQPAVPIVGILTTGRTKNRKIGSMDQLWILPAGRNPVDAHTRGVDRAVCGTCPLRSGGCYVVRAQAPLSVYRAYQRGRYARSFAGTDRPIRLGAYGDPGAVPVSVIQRVVSAAPAWTGYTQRWREVPELRAYCMASVYSAADALEAQSHGWRTFRVAPDTDRLSGEIVCPASRLARVQCRTCLLCNGSRAGRDRRPHVRIAPHGPGRYVWPIVPSRFDER